MDLVGAITSYLDVVPLVTFAKDPNPSLLSSSRRFGLLNPRFEVISLFIIPPGDESRLLDGDSK